MFSTVKSSVLPHLTQRHPKVKIIFRQQIQPWHPSSTLVHEAALAVLRIFPHRFWDFSAALFEHQKDYFDVNVVHESRKKTYERLASLAAECIGGGDTGQPTVVHGRIYDLLKISDKPDPKDGSLNTGNGVTNDVKLITKMARMQGVHVTPTVVFDGVVENGISSGMSGEEWEEWLKKNVD